MKTFPYMDGDRLIELVPLEQYEQLKKACDAAIMKRRDYFLAAQNADAEAEQLRAEVEELRTQRNKFKAEFATLSALIQRLHLAITARMSADDPTDAQRLELRLAWQEAGAVLDQSSALPVTPNAAECGQCADKTPTTPTTETA
jgi:hypothetical protein